MAIYSSLRLSLDSKLSLISTFFMDYIFLWPNILNKFWTFCSWFFWPKSLKPWNVCLFWFNVLGWVLVTKKVQSRVSIYFEQDKNGTTKTKSLSKSRHNYMLLNRNNWHNKTIDIGKVKSLLYVNFEQDQIVTIKP